MVKYLVVGAGISGATIANCISQDVKNTIDVIDKHPYVGGNCYDYLDKSGITIHNCGSHIFHTNSKEIWEYVHLFSPFNSYKHRVLVIIEGHGVPLPFSLITLHKVLPDTVADTIERKLLACYPYGSSIPIRNLMTHLDDDLSFITQFIYEKIFLHYTEKQWGKSPEDVDASITARVPIVLNRDAHYFQDTYQGIPICGYTEMIRRMLDRPNITISLNTGFKDINNLEEYDRIFFTGPVDELMDYQLGVLPYRSERFVLETHNCVFYQEVAVVNYPNGEDFTRIHEYKHYLNDKSPVTVIAKEYPEEFVPGKNEPYYPVPGKENEELHRKYIELAQKKYPNMVFLGRLGDYKYYNMDQAVARAMEVAKEYM